LTNAYGGLTQIAVTDDYGHWLHGSQLDFVICHELAHLKQKDALKTLGSIGAIFAAVSTALLVMPQLPMPWRVFFNFVAILLPLMVFYALSRGQEYEADRLSVEVTGEPEMAIRALAGLYRSAEVPSQLSRLAELFSTHPGFWSRVDAIARQGGVRAEQVSEVLESFVEARTRNGRS
jgi:Zn-dependent protease with chaperone function